MKLQRDWNLDPQGLPFASHIKGRALISVVQQGLRYYHLSKTIDQVEIATDVIPVPDSVLTSKQEWTTVDTTATVDVLLRP